VDSLDPFGERNALRELGLEKGASQEEIRVKYRELTKVHHPDKVKGSAEEKEAAQERYVAVTLPSFHCTAPAQLYTAQLYTALHWPGLWRSSRRTSG
jgi:hypothetical protein